MAKGWMCRDDLKMLVLLGEAMDQTTAVMHQHGYRHRDIVKK